MRRSLAPFLLSFLMLSVNGCRSTPASTDNRPFLIERGTSAREIANRLVQEGYIRHRWSFLLWVKLSPGKIPALRPGRYALDPSWSGRRIYRELRKGPPSARVTFPEGWTSRQMAAVLEAQNVLTASVFLEKVEKGLHEGYLFPDTYVFDQQSDPDAVIRHMRQRFSQKQPSDFSEQARQRHLSELQLVTLASIVEREARVPEERPIIAGVFLNRLRKGWRLESCATVEYALGAWKPRLTYKDLEVASPYNTYRRKGLPPGPIGNPGAAALDAAAHPAQTDMMFFVAQGDGTHRFSQYYGEHLNAQKQKVRGKR